MTNLASSIEVEEAKDIISRCDMHHLIELKKACDEKGSKMNEGLATLFG